MRNQYWRKITILALFILMGGGMSSRVCFGADLIEIDGSSTVYPVSKLAVEAFNKEFPEFNIAVNVSGTGGGFKRLCKGEIAICDASRKMKTEEKNLCQQNGIEFIELMIGYDGITVVVNPQNTWVNKLTVSELKKIWEPQAEANIVTWNMVREEWPARPIVLVSPGKDSGTYGFFTQAIVGSAGVSRQDVIPSEEDDLLVEAISYNPYSLGYFGVSYYKKNIAKLKPIAIDDGNAENGDGFFLPSDESLERGNYQPLARPLFVYINKKAAIKVDHIKKFVDFYLDGVGNYVSQSGYIPLGESKYTEIRKKFEDAFTVEK